MPQCRTCQPFGSPYLEIQSNNVPSRANSLAEGETGEFLPHAPTLRRLFGILKLTGKFEKLLRLLGFSDA